MEETSQMTDHQHDFKPTETWNHRLVRLMHAPTSFVWAVVHDQVYVCDCGGGRSLILRERKMELCDCTKPRLVQSVTEAG